VGRAPQTCQRCCCRSSSNGLVLIGGARWAGQQRHFPCALSGDGAALGIVRLGRYGGASGSGPTAAASAKTRSHALIVVVHQPMRNRRVVRFRFNNQQRVCSRPGGRPSLWWSCCLGGRDGCVRESSAAAMGSCPGWWVLSRMPLLGEHEAENWARICFTPADWLAGAGANQGQSTRTDPGAESAAGATRWRPTQSATGCSLCGLAGRPARAAARA